MDFPPLHVVSTQLKQKRPAGEWDRDTLERPIDITRIGAGLNTFLKQMTEIFKMSEKCEGLGEFQLEEISFSAEVSVDGDFRLVGTGASHVAGGMRFSLKRKHRPDNADIMRQIVGTESNSDVGDNKFRSRVVDAEGNSPVTVKVVNPVQTFETNVPLPVVIAGA